MYFFLIAFVIAMIAYLLHELNMAKAKKKFDEVVQNLEHKNTKMSQEVNILKAKEEFYSHLTAQLEGKTEEVINLSKQITQLKTELEILKNNK